MLQFLLRYAVSEESEALDDSPSPGTGGIVLLLCVPPSAEYCPDGDSRAAKNLRDCRVSEKILEVDGVVGCITPERLGREVQEDTMNSERVWVSLTVKWIVVFAAVVMIPALAGTGSSADQKKGS